MCNSHPVSLSCWCYFAISTTSFVVKKRKVAVKLSAMTCVETEGLTKYKTMEDIPSVFIVIVTAKKKKKMVDW